jgi:hypothetical protein
MSERNGTDGNGTEAKPDTASTLFDLRTVIGLLFGVYGIILTILGIVDQDPQMLAKSGGIHMNLWSGIVMIVLAGVFFLWVRLRPPLTGVPEDAEVNGPGKESGSAG